MRLPIVAGPLRGRWWLPQSRGKILRILGGTYEPEQTRLFQQHIPAGATVLDIGAHVGYYTLLSAVLVGRTGRVCAFEPNPANHAFLRRHVSLNRLDNVIVENAAVSDRAGSASFSFGTGSGTGHLDDGGTLAVQTVTVDGFCAAHGLSPGFMKIDVEGAELHVLRGARSVIDAVHPTLFLSTHGHEIHEQCLAWLREAGYDLQPVDAPDLGSATEVLCT